MSVGRICTRIVHTAAPDETVRAAAVRMDREGVGSLVVVDDASRPIGILTDRDVAVRCVSQAVDPDRARVAEVMSVPVSTVLEGTPIESAIRMMVGARARRSVVVNPAGALVGVLALDDVLELLAEEVEAVGELVRAQSAE